MNKLFLSLALLVPTIASAITLDTEFKVGDASHKEAFVIKEDDAVSFVYRDMVRLEVRAIPHEEGVIVDVTTMKKDDAGNYMQLSHDQTKTEWNKEVSVKCPSDKIEQEYELVITANKDQA